MIDETSPSVILDGTGRPARAALKRDANCPRCRGKKRVASSGFGPRHPVCLNCGFEWHDEAFDPDEENR